jgi:hypothetical protein
MRGKAAFLQKLTERVRLYQRSIELNGNTLAGSSPPSVFVGRYGYPKVSVGPLLPPFSGDTRQLDAPERWIDDALSAEQIADMRMQLVRGKMVVNVHDAGRSVQQMQDIALAARSPDVEALLATKPYGSFFHEEIQPFGPSAELASLRVHATRFDAGLEKAYYDTDALAKDAVLELYKRREPVSAIQRALSVGALGVKRRLVPTRWSITAVDSTLSDIMLENVRTFDTIDEYRVYEFESLRNRFIVLLEPALWGYEWVEAFFVRGGLRIFSDSEGFAHKKEYSSVGGCYYSARLAVAEQLAAERRQASAIILREAYEDYMPLGVWNVRENLRRAFKTKPKAFETAQQARAYAFARLRVPEKTWRENSRMLQNSARQRSLKAFV